MFEKIFGAVDSIVKNTLGKLITDKDKANELTTQIQLALLQQLPQQLAAQKDVLLAELGGESWMQRNWRPILMLTIVAIVANNYILTPYLAAMFGWSVTLDLPDALWNLMQLGVGGYIAGRSIEKTLNNWKNGESGK